MAAVVELVAEVGYHRLTVDAIAARAHASKMTMYRKWPGKAELVAEALRRQADGPRPEPADTGSLRGDLIAAVDEIAQTIAGGGGLSLISLAEAVREDLVLRELVRGQIEDRCQRDGTVIAAHAIARGEPAAAALGPAVLGLAVAQLFTTTLLHGAPPRREARRRLVDDLLLPLLAARAG